VNEPRPGEPVCSCRDLEPLLAAYVDGEAPACDRDKVRAHVEACPCCRDRLTGERAAREALRAHRGGLRPSAPDALKARCASFAARGETAEPGVTAEQGVASAFRRKDAPPLRRKDSSAAARPRRNLLLRWAPLSLAATLLLAVGVVFGFGLTNKVQALAFQTTIDHVKCFRLNAGAHTDDAADAAGQWQSRFGWKIGVPASSRDAQLELRGVRRCGVLDGRVAHIMYSWMGEPLSVYVLPKQALGPATQFVSRFRHNSVMWSQNDRTYIMVTSHRHDPALAQMVAYVRSTAY
jgi:anti-sigma factor RsiW